MLFSSCYNASRTTVTLGDCKLLRINPSRGRERWVTSEQCQSALGQCAFSVIQVYECEGSVSPHVTVRWQRCPEGLHKPQRYLEAAAGSRYISIVLTVRSLETRPCGRSGGWVQPLTQTAEILQRIEPLQSSLSATLICVHIVSHIRVSRCPVSSFTSSFPSSHKNFFTHCTFIRLQLQFHELIFLSNMKKVG